MFSPRLYKATGCGCVCISPGEMVRAPDSRASTGTMASPQKVDFARPPKFSSKTCDHKENQVCWHMQPLGVCVCVKNKAKHEVKMTCPQLVRARHEGELTYVIATYHTLSDIIYHNFIARNMCKLHFGSSYGNPP